MPIDVLDAFAGNLSCSTLWNRFTVISIGSGYSRGKGDLTPVHPPRVVKVYHACGAVSLHSNAIAAHGVAR